MAIAELNNLVRSLNKFIGNRKRTGVRKAKPVIDIETLQIWPSMSSCADHLQTSPASVFGAIIGRTRCKKRLLEYFDNWLVWPNKEKEKYTRKNNIYFY